MSAISVNKNNFNQEVLSSDKPVLLDVRTPDEYRQGHIPGSKNVPLQSISKVAGIIDNKSTPIFVHCLSGARSRQAAAVFAANGLYQREKHRRNFRLCRKGGTII